MSEREMFIHAWESEFPRTVRVMKAYPSDKGDWKPHERSRSARDLEWTIVAEPAVMGKGAVAGAVTFDSMPQAPATMEAIWSEYESASNEIVSAVKNMSDDDFNAMVKFPGPSGTMRRGDIFWVMLMDTIHHRGQLSVYVRMAGGKVPSIYGPSADEGGV